MKARSVTLSIVALALGGPHGATAAERAVVDLMTVDGAAQVGAIWRHADVNLVRTTHRAPDADGQPNGAPVKTWDYAPRAGTADFDDSQWAVLEPAKTNARLGNGRFSFHWYRVAVTVPEKISDLDTRGAALYFDTTLDDCAEVWVDGAIARGLGQVGGSVIAGWNAQNHVLLARQVTPGQKIQIAVFAANGPLSDPPATSASTRRTIWSIAPTARSSSPIRSSDCRSSGTTRAASSTSPASTRGRTEPCAC
jgi:gluconolactonase